MSACLLKWEIPTSYNERAKLPRESAPFSSFLKQGNQLRTEHYPFMGRERKSRTYTHVFIWVADRQNSTKRHARHKLKPTYIYLTQERFKSNKPTFPPHSKSTQSKKDHHHSNQKPTMRRENQFGKIHLIQDRERHTKGHTTCTCPIKTISDSREKRRCKKHNHP